MKKFGRLNGRKAERGKRGETRRDGANKRDARFAQGVVKFATSKRYMPYRAQIYAAPQVCTIKFYADFGKIMKFHAGFRHGDFSKIVKFRVEFRRGFYVAAKSCIEFQQG